MTPEQRKEIENLILEVLPKEVGFSWEKALEHDVLSLEFPDKE